MARTAEQDKIFKEERKHGRKAAKMAQDHVLSILKQRLQIRNQGSEDFAPILKATRISHKMGNYRLLGLNFTSNKAGFIHHYGFKGVRDATTVLLSASRYNKSATTRESHNFTLKERKLFEDIYASSGALDYLVKALGETRLSAVEAKLNGLILELNKEDK